MQDRALASAGERASFLSARTIDQGCNVSAGKRRLFIAAMCAAMGPAKSAFAQNARGVARTYSPYEVASIEEALSGLGAQLDEAPEGKTVEGIDVVTLDVVEPRDPAPRALNLLHATTRRAVIEREVLMSEGDAFSSFLCDETARNLRLLQQLSLVICAATTTSTGVRVLIIAKDVWSLRMGWDLSFTGGRFNSLQLVPTETNLGGTHQIALARYVYQPQSQSLSIGYRIPRLAGRRLNLVAEAGLIWNRNGDTEGSTGSISIAKPQYSAHTEWAWSVGSGWRDEIYRRYLDGLVTQDKNGVPWAYGARRAAEAAYVTRSFGFAVKHDVTFGAEMNIRSFHALDAPGVSPENIAAFARLNLPRSDTRVGPFLQYRSYTSDFLRVLDFETLGLQEDLRLGHDTWLRVYPVSEALGSSRTFLGTYAGVQYTLPLFGDGLARAGLESMVEAESGRLSDASFEADLRLVTPRLGIGRIVFDGIILNRYRNYLNRQSYLGGDGRLRGYPSNFFPGKDIAVYNLEFRSRPIEILSCQLGGALFYDAGHVANGIDRLHLRHSVGVGFRILFPQLDRVVFRGDIGFPLARPLEQGVAPYTASVAFEQAFSLPSVGGRVSSATSAAGWLGQ